MVKLRSGNGSLKRGSAANRNVFTTSRGSFSEGKGEPGVNGGEGGYASRRREILLVAVPRSQRGLSTTVRKKRTETMGGRAEKPRIKPLSAGKEKRTIGGHQCRESVIGMHSQSKKTV